MMKLSDEEYIEDLTIENGDFPDYSNREFLGCTFKGIQFSENQIKSSKFIECKFKNCNFNNPQLTGCSFREVVFFDSKLVGLHWAQATSVSSLSFNSCHIEFCVFDNLKLSGLKLIDSNCRNSEFTQNDLRKSSFQGSHLRDSQFTKCDLRDSNFTNTSHLYIDLESNQVKGIQLDMTGALSLVEQLGIKVQL